MAKWFVTTKKADFEGIAKEFGISPILARLIRNRDIIEVQDIRKYLHGTVEDLYDPFLLKGMEKTVSILKEKITSCARIRVIGDYDADGICGTHILVKGLRTLGALVDTVIPHRIKDGYGLSDTLITEAFEDKIDTIITCDNGIAAAKQIKLAKDLGLTVIVTDHHEVPFTSEDEPEESDSRVYLLPPADALVDPKQPDCAYPYKQICGATVALKVVEALYIHMGVTITKELRDEFICLAAIATVCDVMELGDENRIIVKYGLEQIKKCGNVGIRALIDVNGIDDKKLSVYHIGFIIGPCLNAAGRLDTAERALSLLNTEDSREAANIANDLKNINESRKEMTAKEVDKAIAIVEEMFHEGSKTMFHGEKKAIDSVLVIYLPDCHESLAGIIAGRLREHFSRPAFVLTNGEEDIKGSGRSIEAYNMYDEMCKCKELFIKFGGHKMAAGLSMKPENIEELRQLLNQNTTLTEDDFIEKVKIDIAMPLSYISPGLISEFKLLEPFGVANPKPVFAQKDLRLISGQTMGKSGRAAKYKVIDEDNKQYEILYFGDIEAFNKFLSENHSAEQMKKLYQYNQHHPELKPMKINITYYPDIAVYQGNESLRIVMQNYC